LTSADRIKGVDVCRLVAQSETDRALRALSPIEEEKELSQTSPFTPRG
jgi:hypothetical protein